MKYLVISRADDSVSFELMEGDYLLRWLQDATITYRFIGRSESIKVLRDLPKEFPARSILIIKGDVVIPQKANVYKLV